MTELSKLLEATLESLPEGVGLVDEMGEVVFWNRAAEAITGYASREMVAKQVPPSLKPLLEGRGAGAGATSSDARHGSLVHSVHNLGHEVAAMARSMVLRDGAAHCIGTAILFHPAESLDSLPHGDMGENENFAASLEDLKERLDSLFDDFVSGGPAFGVLWITLDQARDLRKTHGTGACEAMFQKVERALSQGLRPAERMGRWGGDEYLVLSHERTPAMLAMHAKVLAGLARTADFRWWGDRISLTVSIGAAQAENGGTLIDLLDRVKAAMTSSSLAGGNCITLAPEGHPCLPS
jgi:diguanylate cyclase (GGDEF)-like protein